MTTGTIVSKSLGRKSWTAIAALFAMSFFMSGSASAADKKDGKEETTKIERTRNGEPVEVGNKDPAMDYVLDNVLATLYHEFAHAMIDMLELPILGQEEDAADVLSALMIHERHPEFDAIRIAENSVLSFAFDADEDAATGRQPSFWDEHGPARQRYYNTICIFYGANPAERGEFVKKLGLPESRAEYCPGEFEMATRSWEPILERLRIAKNEGEIRFRQDTRIDIGRAAARDLEITIKKLNDEFSMPESLEIVLKRCGGEDRGYQAFYSQGAGGRGKITICGEYVQDLHKLASDVF